MVNPFAPSWKAKSNFSIYKYIIYKYIIYKYINNI